MKAKLIVDGKTIEVEISQEEYEKLIVKAEKKKTGYEKIYYVSEANPVYYDSGDGDVCWTAYDDSDGYQAANYYSSKVVAENNARADKLMRQLRRFAVEHREKDIDWNKRLGLSFIGFAIDTKDLIVLNVGWARSVGEIVFDSGETANLAIETFKDELTWYFTEYKNSL